ncbi:AzlC family ABC transporter permease [Streptomyces sp. XH2]|uniref:AzlC family ABC transporter permease n=1 Tax=Streptomyces sp. XH2 TaxID=3412483 RepID=UPI003C7A1F93
MDTTSPDIRQVHTGTTASEPASVTAPEPGNLAGALRDTISVGIGMVPLGFAFGLLVIQSGLAWWWAPVFSLMIYSASLEFPALALILSMTSLPQLAVTAFLVNFRHVFYGPAFPLHRVKGKAAKTYSMYALTDEAYALTATRPAESLTSGRILWIQVLLQSYWVLGGITGALFGALISLDLAGLEFCMAALFTALAIDTFRAGRDIPSPLLALGCALLALAVAPGQMLVVAMSLFAATLVVRYLLHRRKEQSRA